MQLLFTISIKNKLVYRFDVLFSIIGSVMYIAINILLWRYLYREDPNMVAYMTAYTILANIISMIYTQKISGTIGKKISSGDYVTDLLRPKSFFFMEWQVALAEIAVTLLLRGLPIILLFLPILHTNIAIDNLALALIALVLGHVLYLLIYSLIGFSAFILIEVWPINRLVNDTSRLLAGSFIPLSVMPEFLQKIANVLPFRFLYSFPLELLLGSFDKSNLWENYGILLIWILVFAVLDVVMYGVAKYKAVVQGG